MTFKVEKIAFTAAIISTLGMTGVVAQSFDEGSFDNPGPSASAPAANESVATSGFGESSFEEGGSGGGDVALAPVDTNPTETGPVVGGNAAPGGGFEEGSFDDNTGGSTAVVENGGDSFDPAGGDDFPGGVDIPDNGTEDAIVDGGRPNLPEQEQRPVDQQGPQPVDPQITQMETRDFGVPPQNTLRQGQLHGATPLAIPGANLVTTANLVEAMNAGVAMVLIDVLGADYTIRGAYSATALASPGNFGDRTQQQANAWLRQITQGNASVPIVVFCSDPMCWLSYNGSLRTINAGFDNVYWYRGGLQAWQMAGLPLHPAGF